jgi:Fe-S-cluster containining protein
MNIFARQTKGDWFIAGLAFECQGCGRCCAGPEEGFVWLTDTEAVAIARHLRLSEKAFRDRYVRTIGRRQSLIEQKKSKDCVFLRDGQCQIYPVRPTQCRTWPFWHSNIASPEDWSMAGMRCKGINRGALHEPEHIRSQADATRE